MPPVPVRTRAGGIGVLETASTARASSFERRRVQPVGGTVAETARRTVQLVKTIQDQDIGWVIRGPTSIWQDAISTHWRGAFHHRKCARGTAIQSGGQTVGIPEIVESRARA